MHFRTDFTGRDRPATDEGWDDLPACDLAALLTVNGMLTAEEEAKQGYIKLQLAIVRSNLMEARIEHQFVRLERQQAIEDAIDADLGSEDERTSLLATCREELERRGVDLQALEALTVEALDAELDTPPSSA